MKNKLCTIFAITHMVCISLSSLVASFVIESIIVSGFVCTLLALVTFAIALACKRYIILVACTATIATAATFVIVELVFSVFGPRQAALPLCLLFLVVQAITTVITLNDVRRRSVSESGTRSQYSFRTMLVGTVLFASAFAITQRFPASIVPHISNWSVAFRYPWLIATSLAMLLLMTFGLTSIIQESNRLKNSSEADSI